MSIAGSEIETVILNNGHDGADDETQQVDAQEDREIVGWDFTVKDVGTGQNARVSGSVFVGVDPDVAIDSATDLGGKFYDTFGLTQTGDQTNGVGAVYEDLDGHYDLGGPLSFDWNEDVTLTLESTQATSEGSVQVEATIYYREV